MKKLPHIAGIAFFLFTIRWLDVILGGFGVAQKTIDTQYTLTATGWGAVVGVWPVALAGGLVFGGMAYFVGLFLGESWVTRDLQKQAWEVVEQAERERLLYKSNINSLNRWQEEAEQEIQVEKFKVHKRLQAVKQREKNVSEREKVFESLEQELALEREKNKRLLERLIDKAETED